jgi:ribonuclease HI
MTEKIQKVVIYTDGGARGNPGPAAIGVVLFNSSDSLNPIKELGQYIGNATNNQAEYQALLAGLEEALVLGASEVFCFLDSELVVRQLQGRYKIKESNLKELAARVFRLSSKFRHLEFKHVLREKNKLADKLVNEALDEAGFKKISGFGKL